MQEEIIISIEDYNQFVKDNLLAVVYFSTPLCGVCKVIKPKIFEMLKEEFPETKFGYVDASAHKEIASQQSIFTVPTILFFAEGKEFLRESRNIDLSKAHSTLLRIYSLIFN